MDDVVTAVSLCGTGLGILSRVPQIARVIRRRSADDLSSRALGMNVLANLCFLSYSTWHAKWPIAINNVAVVSLDGTLLYLRGRYGRIKKNSSDTDLRMLETSSSPPCND